MVSDVLGSSSAHLSAEPSIITSASEVPLSLELLFLSLIWLGDYWLLNAKRLCSGVLILPFYLMSTRRSPKYHTIPPHLPRVKPRTKVYYVTFPILLHGRLPVHRTIVGWKSTPRFLSLPQPNLYPLLQ